MTHRVDPPKQAKVDDENEDNDDYKKDDNDDDDDDTRVGRVMTQRALPPTRGKALRARAITTIDASSIKTDTHTKHSLENTNKYRKTQTPNIVIDFVSITLFL